MKRLALILTVVALGSVALGDYFFSNGATSKSLDFLVRGPTGEPNLVLDTETDLDLYCTRVGDSRQKLGDLTLSDGVAADWNDLECIHLGNGHYRVDIPDANLANGIGTTLIYEIIDTNTTNTFDQAWVVVHLNAPVDTTAWKGTAVATPKTAGKPAVEVNEVDGYAVNAGAAITVAAAVGQTATAAANIEEVYVAHYATDWNDVTNMWSVDVNAVRGASPMSTTDVTAAVPTLSDIGDKVVADMDANATAVDAVLANSAQGGAAAVLTLDSLIISNADGVGVTITGTSDGILVTGTAGDGVHFMSSGSNGHGLTVAGNGSGDGMNLSTGSGQGLQVSSSSGVGVQITGTDAMTLSGTDDGLEIAGGTGNGIETTSTGASAVYFHAGSSGNGDGLTLAGYGAGEGLGVRRRAL